MDNVKVTKRGDVVTLRKNQTDIWIKRTQEDVDALHQKDRDDGR